MATEGVGTSSKKERERHAEAKVEEDVEGFFEASLFVDENYVIREHRIGNHVIPAYSSQAASTDFDLTGQLVWPGAEMLNEYLCQHEDKLKGKTILELGAGVGLTGLLCSRYCSKVVMTDHNDTVLKMINQNIALHKSNEDKSACSGVLAYAKLEWGNTEHMLSIKEQNPEGFDFVLGADLCYQQESMKPLFDTVVELMLQVSGRRCAFLLAYIDRWNSIGSILFEEAAGHGLQIQKVLEKDIGMGGLHGTVFEMTFAKSS